MIPTDTKDIGLGAELGRKAIHLCALVIPSGLLFIPLGTVRIILFVAFLLSVLVDIIRWRGGPASRWLKRVVGSVLRPHEDRRYSGATYILAAGALCPLLFPVPVAVAALIFIILGDTAAVFVGRYLGRVKIGHKTLEGSLAFFVAASLGVLWMTDLPLSVRLIGAASAAFSEALPLPIDDNLSVPIIAGAVMMALLA